MLYTGRRFTAAELDRHGFFNRVVAPGDVLTEAMLLAGEIATKSLPAVAARKRVFTAVEGLGWYDGYLAAQAESAALVALRDGAEGVEASLGRREPRINDD